MNPIPPIPAEDDGYFQEDRCFEDDGYFEDEGHSIPGWRAVLQTHLSR